MIKRFEIEWPDDNLTEILLLDALIDWALSHDFPNDAEDQICVRELP